MGVETLLIGIGLLAVIFGGCFGLLWLAARFVHPALASVLGGAVVALLAYWTVDGFNACDAPPVYRPPAPGQPGEGAMIFACDGPGGQAAYIGLFLMVPFIVGLALVTLTIWRRETKRRLERVNPG